MGDPLGRNGIACFAQRAPLRHPDGQGYAPPCCCTAHGAHRSATPCGQCSARARSFLRSARVVPADGSVGLKSILSIRGSSYEKDRSRDRVSRTSCKCDSAIHREMFSSIGSLATPEDARSNDVFG
jgi:hypothetical protein